MMEYRTKLSRQVKWMWMGSAAFLLLAAGLLLFVRVPLEEEFMQGFVSGMQTGLLAMMAVMLLTQAVRSQRAVKDDALLKKMYIEQTDERSRLIRDKIGNVGFTLIISVLMLATVVAGYMDKTVFLTLLGTLLVVVLTKAGLKLYYRRKY